MSGRVLVSGARGLVGSALVARLEAGGRAVSALTRTPAAASDVAWDPARGALDAGALEGFDAVVHLAGEPMGARWTRARLARVRASRVGGTALLAARLAALGRPPRALVAVSAIGFYGDRGEEPLDEASPPGTGVLPALCVDWERAADPARAAGIRVAHPRLGLVLTPRGGALPRLLPLFRLGLGGPVGNPRTWWSWVTLDDVTAAIVRLLDDDRLAGPVNVTAPGAARAGEVARALGRALRRPALLPVPALALRAVFGRMARETLLASARIRPARLEAAGFAFRDPAIGPALDRLLAGGRERAAPGAAA